MDDEEEDVEMGEGEEEEEEEEEEKEKEKEKAIIKFLKEIFEAQKSVNQLSIHDFHTFINNESFKFLIEKFKGINTISRGKLDEIILINFTSNIDYNNYLLNMSEKNRFYDEQIFYDLNLNIDHYYNMFGTCWIVPLLESIKRTPMFNHNIPVLTSIADKIKDDPFKAHYIDYIKYFFMIEKYFTTHLQVDYHNTVLNAILGILSTLISKSDSPNIMVSVKIIYNFLKYNPVFYNNQKYLQEINFDTRRFFQSIYIPYDFPGTIFMKQNKNVRKIIYSFTYKLGKEQLTYKLTAAIFDSFEHSIGYVLTKYGWAFLENSNKHFLNSALINTGDEDGDHNDSVYYKIPIWEGEIVEKYKLKFVIYSLTDTNKNSIRFKKAHKKNIKMHSNEISKNYKRYKQSNTAKSHYAKERQITHEVTTVFDIFDIESKRDFIDALISENLSSDYELLKNYSSFECLICRNPVFYKIFYIEPNHFFCSVDCLYEYNQQFGNQYLSCVLCRTNISNHKNIYINHIQGHYLSNQFQRKVLKFSKITEKQFSELFIEKYRIRVTNLEQLELFAPITEVDSMLIEDVY